MAEQLAARAGASKVISKRLDLRSKTFPQKMGGLKRVEINWAGTLPAMACHSALEACIYYLSRVATVGLGVSEFVYRIIALLVSVVSGIDSAYGFGT